MLRVGEREYYHARICPNGHVFSGSLESVRDDIKQYCEDCGKLTIIRCNNCNEYIQGWIYNRHVSIAIPFTPHSFCIACGKEYPWTTAKKEAFNELIDFENSLSEKEKEVMKGTIDDIINETPKTEIAALKLKAGLRGLGKETARAARGLIVDIASETAKKVFFGPES